MKLAFNILLIMICINLACYILNEAQISQTPPTQTPQQLIFNISLDDIIVSVLFIAGALIAAYFTGNNLGAGILILVGISILTPVGDLLITGFPLMLESWSVPYYFVWVAKIFIYFATFVLVLELLTQKEIA